jgi:hypothetical protein
MPGRRDKNCEARRSEQRRYELPDAPGRVPGIRPRALAFEPIAARSMELRIDVSGIDQHIGIDRQD